MFENTKVWIFEDIFVFGHVLKGNDVRIKLLHPLFVANNH